MTKQELLELIEDARKRGDLATIQKIKAILEKKKKPTQNKNDLGIAQTRPTNIGNAGNNEVEYDENKHYTKRVSIGNKHDVKFVDDNSVIAQDPTPERILVPRTRPEFKYVKTNCGQCGQPVQNLHPVDYKQRIASNDGIYVCDVCICNRRR